MLELHEKVLRIVLLVGVIVVLLDCLLWRN
jgi:hypothetical protein